MTDGVTLSIPQFIHPLPPPLMTSEPGSFARFTIEQRKPEILRQVIADNDYPPDVVTALETFAEELRGEQVRLLSAEDGPGWEVWHPIWRAYEGATWLELPWYFAESFFYWRLLNAVGYFRSGSLKGKDPFAPAKQRELARQWNSIQRLAAFASRIPADAEEVHLHFETLLHYTLWGNRADLSNQAVSESRGAQPMQRERENLLQDDTDALLHGWASQTMPLAVFINDNGGIELAADLALADFLLRTRRAERIIFHLKVAPFFVSDAMPQDADTLLARLAGDAHAETRALGHRLHAHLEEGRLRWETHPFWNSPQMLWEIPEDLRDSIEAASLVILKGDANYRRLLGDLHWPATTSVQDVARYFPADLLIMRTLKSEIVVGLAEGQAETLFQDDPDWLINGQRGLICWVCHQTP